MEQANIDLKLTQVLLLSGIWDYIKFAQIAGLGLQLLVDTLRLVCPSHIIQLWCQQKYQNCEPINENFYLQPSWEDMTKVSVMLEEDETIFVF